MVKVAQIGIGRWGKNLLRNFYQLGNLSLVCELDQKNIAAAQAQYPGLRFTQSVTDIFNDPTIDGVVIATPAATHFELGKQALSAGKHVFIEKPVVLKHEQLEELIALAKQKKKIIMEGHLLLYHPVVNKMKEVIESGLIGDLQHIYFRRSNLGSIRFEANVLWDLGTHDISVVYYLMNEEPKSVSSHGMNVYPQSTEETVFTLIRFPSGRLAHLHESWLDPYKDRKVIAVGSKGMLIMDELATDGKLKFIKKHVSYDGSKQFEHERFQYHDKGMEVIPCSEAEPLRTECEHFLQAIQKGTKVRSDGLNSLRVLKTLEAAQYSLDHEGIPVEYSTQTQTIAKPVVS